MENYGVHVKVVTGSTDVPLKTDPRTLASVYEETLIGACHCWPMWNKTVWCLFDSYTECCHMPATAWQPNMCQGGCIHCLLIGYPGQKTLRPFDLCMACFVLCLPFEFNLLGVGGVEWRESVIKCIWNLNWMQHFYESFTSCNGKNNDLEWKWA